MANIPIKVILSAKDNASKTLNKFGGGLDNIERKSRIVGGALVGLGTSAALLGKRFVNQAATFEQNKMALEVLAGSAELANEQWEKMVEFAKLTPFSFDEVVKGTNQLLAMGSSLEEVIPEMSMLGDVASALNVPLDRLIINFGQVRTQGKLTGRELRDFAVAGVPLYESLADVLGVTKDEIAGMVSEGVVGFDDVKKAFQLMTGEGGKFFEMMERQSQTTAGQVEKLTDSIDILEGKLGEALLPAVNDLLDDLTPLVDKFADWAEENPEMVRTLFKLIGVLTALGGLLLILTPLVKGLAAVFAVLTSTITWVAIPALAFLGLAVYKTVESFNWWKEQMPKIIQAIENGLAKARGAMGQTRNYIANKINDIRYFFNSMTSFIRDRINDIRDWLSSRWASWGVHFHIPGIDWIKNRINDIRSWLSGHWGSWGIHINLPDVWGAVQNWYNSLRGWLGFQHGGTVPGPQGAAIPAVVHGGERIIPTYQQGQQEREGGGGISSNVNLNVYIGMYAGSATEKREIARQLWHEVGNIAKSQNKRPEELIGLN